MNAPEYLRVLSRLDKHTYKCNICDNVFCANKVDYKIRCTKCNAANRVITPKGLKDKKLKWQIESEVHKIFVDNE